MTDQTAQTAQTHQKSTRIAILDGRITARRKITTKEGPRYLTLLKLPAPDAYSSPATVEIESSESLGERDDDWRGRVEIGGYPRSFHARGEDGDSRVIYTATNVLRHIP